MNRNHHNCAIVFLVALYALVYTPAAELFKLPLLVTHFKEHRAADSRLSVLKFLFLHYCTTNQQPDYARDQQLPFKNGECIVAGFTAVCLPNVDKQLPDVPVCILAARPLLIDAAFFPVAFANTIWQPPRLRNLS